MTRHAADEKTRPGCHRNGSTSNTEESIPMSNTKTTAHDVQPLARKLAGDAREAAALLLLIPSALPTIESLHVTRGGIGVYIEERSPRNGFGALMAVAEWAAHFHVPVVVRWSWGGSGNVECTPVIHSTPIKVQTLHSIGTREAYGLGAALGRHLETTGELELAAGDVLVALPKAHVAAGGNR